MTLRELRDKRGLTQVEVAFAGGLEQTTISQLEMGKIADPRASTLQKLAAVYGVKLQVVIDALAEAVAKAAA